MARVGVKDADAHHRPGAARLTAASNALTGPFVPGITTPSPRAAARPRTTAPAPAPETTGYTRAQEKRLRGPVRMARMAILLAH
ncbi:hypothetical protein [Streptomyces atrovirens]|uniref:Uncharacterized protein n=1 Tax=Streptomyces atrovirens TaxID=285556 RepID=A0ABW0E3B0_9ACTN